MGDKTLAHYRIVSKLGEGGMGEVYRATDTKLPRDVALKLLPAAFTDSAERLERFRREARALAAFSHPNIGGIHGIEETDGTVALVLELIEGETLADRVAALSLRDGAVTIIARGSNPRFVAPSTLVFLQRTALVAAPFDPSSLQLTGPERALHLPGAKITTVPGLAGEHVVGAIARNGTALLPLDQPQTRTLVWVDRSGNETPTGFAFDSGDHRAYAANGAFGAGLSPDGKSILGYVVTEGANRDLWIFGLDGTDTPVLQTPANERAPALSPGGRAFAYVSDESGQDEVYLRLYPDSARVWQLSRNGVVAPLWTRDGSELYYQSGNRMMAVPINLEGGVSMGVPEELFPMGAYEEDPFGMPMHDVAADGRFLMVRSGAGSRVWRLIQNWGTALEEAVQAE